MATASHRPTGVTIISLALFWFLFSAIGNIFVARSMQAVNFFPPGSPAAAYANAVSSSTFVVLVVFYGVTALVAAVATWRMRSWMALAFLVWSVAALLLGGFFLLLILALLLIPAEFLWGAKAAGALLVMGTAACLWLIYRYLQRVASAASNAAL